MAAQPSSLSSPSHCRQPINSYSCLSPRFPRRTSVNFSFISHDPPPAPKLFSVNSQLLKSDCRLGSKIAASPEGSEASSSSSAIDFLTLCHSLKTTKRRGWINHGIKGPESIADHMYRMSLMALIAGDLPGVNRERCIKIAIVHDIAEAIVGDITPSDGVPKVEKSRREQAALTEMCKVLGGGMRAEEIQELWAEYENNASIEANLVKDFDKVEMILQALEYEMAGKLYTFLQNMTESSTSSFNQQLENFKLKLERVGLLRSLPGETQDWEIGNDQSRSSFLGSEIM